VITIQVMTFTKVSAKDQDAVSALFQSLYYQIRMDHTRTHYSDCAHIGGILQTGNTRQISSGVCAPITEKSDNYRFVFFSHRNFSLYYFKHFPGPRKSGP
jgi:hypothetical protein